MDPHEAATLLLAKMAHADGDFAAEERKYLASVLPQTRDLDALLERAKDYDVPSLVGPLTEYADRFVVAMRVAVMATINLDLDPRERELFDEVVDRMQLEDDDRMLILHEVGDLATQEVRKTIHPRVAELRAQSCLSPGASAVWPWP